MAPDDRYLGWVTGRLRLIALVGGVVLAAGTVAAAAGLFGIGAEPACGCPPGPQFEAEPTTVDGSPAVTVRHVGGDAVRAGRLSVVVDGRAGSWAERAGLPANEPVEAGDSVTVVGVERGAVVRLVWDAEKEAGGPVTLAELAVGED